MLEADDASIIAWTSSRFCRKASNLSWCNSTRICLWESFVSPTSESLRTVSCSRTIGISARPSVWDDETCCSIKLSIAHYMVSQNTTYRMTKKVMRQAKIWQTLIVQLKSTKDSDSLIVLPCQCWRSLRERESKQNPELTLASSSSSLQSRA